MTPEGFRGDGDAPSPGHMDGLLGGAGGLQGMGEGFIPLGQGFDLVKSPGLVGGPVACSRRAWGVNGMHGDTFRC